ncbi:hypothetical protein COT08_00305, partial [Candidatus Woesebacteria bacterium CG07_land_8_20_14_0_80_44_9]
KGQQPSVEPPSSANLSYRILTFCFISSPLNSLMGIVVFWEEVSSGFPPQHGFLIFLSLMLSIFDIRPLLF